MRAQIRLLEDGRRLHLHDGPIDLIVEAFGEADEISAAYGAAASRFVNVLDELCRELTFLRQARGQMARSLRALSQDAWSRPLRPTASGLSSPRWQLWQAQSRKRSWRL